MWKTKKNLQEAVADSGVVVHPSAMQHYLHKQDLHGRVCGRKPYQHPQHKIQCQRYATEHIHKPDAFQKQVLQTNVLKKNSLASISKGIFLEKKEQIFMNRTPCQLVSMGVDLSCIVVVYS